MHTIQAHLFIWWREQHTEIQGAHSSSNRDGRTTHIVHQGECVSSHLARDNTKAKPFILHMQLLDNEETVLDVAVLLVNETSHLQPL